MRISLLVFALLLMSCGSGKGKGGSSFDPDKEDGPKIEYLIGKTIEFRDDEDSEVVMTVKIESASAYSGKDPEGETIAGTFTYSVGEFGSKFEMTATAPQADEATMTLGWSDATSGIGTYSLNPGSIYEIFFFRLVD